MGDDEIFHYLRMPLLPLWSSPTTYSMKKAASVLTLLLFLLHASCACAADPVRAMLERIDKGASEKFLIERAPADSDYFELSDRDGRILVRGRDNVSIAAGIGWYLKYYAHVHLTWNSMTARLPERLPVVGRPVRHSARTPLRYYLNYCTASYSMAFWDWERWERELDWMALHGINLALDVVGTDVVWRNVLRSLGYTRAETDAFIAGPAFQAWWLMGNLEGWGGPNGESWYRRQERLQRRILARMREWGIHPVLPGYSGMVPHDARERLGLNVADPGLWCDYRRPAFLLPTDPKFADIARRYYREQRRLYGVADYYSMDPFHEGGSVGGVDLAAAGTAIMTAMKEANPHAVWVAQAWQSCPHPEMIRHLDKGSLLVLDLYSESRPQWGDPASAWYRPQGFDGHDWAYCMLLNYGGNVGLFGKLRHVADEYYKALRSPFSPTLRAVGLTMEGIENNPVMYELVTELPWRPDSFSAEEWLDGYVSARYGGLSDGRVREAWHLLARSVYACPDDCAEQGTHESILCARPSLTAYQVSTWSEMVDYYDPADVIRAAHLLADAADAYRDNANYAYDLVDVTRQAVAEQARLVYDMAVAAFKARDRQAFDHVTARFLRLAEAQDSLLASMPDFMVGRWLRAARAMGSTAAESDHYEWNARVQITTWGNRTAAEAGGLHDYAHKEWNGLLRDVYIPRWRRFFDALSRQMRGEHPAAIDYYAMDEAWTRLHNVYPHEAQADPVASARRAVALLGDYGQDGGVPGK